MRSLPLTHLMHDRVIEFILPLPLSVNEIYKKSRMGSIYMTHEGKYYKQAVGEYIRNAMARQGIPPLKGNAIVMEIRVAWPNDRYHRDPANLDKLLPDTLQGIVWEGDDSILYPQHYPPAIKVDEYPRVHVRCYASDAEDIPIPLPTPGFREIHDEVVRMKACAKERKKRKQEEKKAAEAAKVKSI